MRWAVVVPLVLLALAAPARAQETVLQLPGDAAFRITGVTRDAIARAAGDVNGDGLADVAILEPGDWTRHDTSLTVVFGQRQAGATVDVRAPGAAGFRATNVANRLADTSEGNAEALSINATIERGRDVNHDGLDDVLLGIANVGNRARLNSGSVFVILGRRETSPVRLDADGPWGFRIDGPQAFSGAGGSVAGPGDVNGDGFGDVLVGGFGGAWLVWGRPATAHAPVDLRQAGSAVSLRRSGPSVRDLDLDAHVAAAPGDVDGDGLADLLVGTTDFYSTTLDRSFEGAAHVIYGRPGLGAVDLARPLTPDAGRTLAALDLRYELVEGIGDVSGDGRSDLAFHARVYLGRARGTGPKPRGDVVELRRVGRGARVQSAGDLDGDGRAEIVIGRRGYDASCRDDAGAVSVIRGPLAGGILDFAEARPVFPTLLGDQHTAGLGGGDVLGDATGDGRPDLLAADVPGGDAPRAFAVVPLAVAPPARAPAKREACLRMRVLERSLAAALRTRRIRVELTVQTPGEYEVYARTVPRDNVFVTGGRHVLGAGETRVVTMRIGPLTARRLAGREVRGLRVCVAFEGLAERACRALRR